MMMYAMANWTMCNRARIICWNTLGRNRLGCVCMNELARDGLAEEERDEGSESEPCRTFSALSGSAKVR